MHEAGTIRHSGHCGRHLSGAERARVARKVTATGPYHHRNELLVGASEERLKDGNTTTVPSYDVLRKAAAEDRARARYYPCVIEDLNLIKRVSKRLDSSERLQCDIHLLSDSPLMVHMYNEHFLRKYGEKPTTLHLDATGSVTKTVGTTHPYFYSLVAEDVDGAYPVGHMLAEMHTVPAITFFLQQIAHDLKIATYGTRKMTPPRVVTDYSWAMLHGISLTFAGMSLPAYIDCAWAAAIGEVPMPSIVMSLCSCHLAHDASRAPVTHIGKQKTQERQMLLWLFGQMQLGLASTAARTDRPLPRDRVHLDTPASTVDCIPLDIVTSNCRRTWPAILLGGVSRPTRAYVASARCVR